MQVKGKGIVKVETSHGKIKQSDNVQFEPNLGYNLLSVEQLITRRIHKERQRNKGIQVEKGIIRIKAGPSILV